MPTNRQYSTLPITKNFKDHMQPSDSNGNGNTRRQTYFELYTLQAIREIAARRAATPTTSNLNGNSDRKMIRVQPDLIASSYQSTLWFKQCSNHQIR